jgi:ribonuclease HI
MLQITVDGGCRGNGTDDARMYGSALIQIVADGKPSRGKLHTWEFGIGTNNQAEYHALIEALKIVDRTFPHDILTIRMDSELVRNQVSGRWKIKDPELRKLCQEAKDILSRHWYQFEHITGQKMKRILGH